jgi:hypothetical protein
MPPRRLRSLQVLLPNSRDHKRRKRGILVKASIFLALIFPALCNKGRYWFDGVGFLPYIKIVLNVNVLS